MEESPSKRPAVEIVDASEAHNMGSAVHILDPVVNETSPLDAAISSIGTTPGSGSSMRHKIYEILNSPNFLSYMGAGIFSRVHEWVQTKEVILYATVKSTFSRPPTTHGTIYQLD